VISGNIGLCCALSFGKTIHPHIKKNVFRGRGFAGALCIKLKEKRRMTACCCNCLFKPKALSAPVLVVRIKTEKRGEMEFCAFSA